MMDNDSLKALWEHASKKMNSSQETEELKTAQKNYSLALKDLVKIDCSRAEAMEEASNNLAYYETYQAFSLGFQEAVGLLMGRVK